MSQFDVTWTPLESNPEVMNKVKSVTFRGNKVFIWKLGVPEKWNVVDVLSLDPEMLGLIPRPALSLILLFPTSAEWESQTEPKGGSGKQESDEKASKDVYFLKQYIHNACGTIALIHSIANSLDSIELTDGSSLKQFLEKTKDMSPEDRGTELQKDQSVAEAHNTIALEGQTEVPTSEVIHHFVAFVQKDGQLYELDGRKASPINHGPTSSDTFVEDAAKVMTDFMKKNPDELRFTVCALAATE